MGALDAAAARVELGRVTTVNPAKREARARIAHGLELDTAALAWAWFTRDSVCARYKVAQAGASDGELRLRFAPGVPMDTVRGLQGAAVAVDAAVLLSRGPLWRRVREMVGLTALTRDGSRAGVVVEAYEGPKTGAIKVESDDGTAWIVPVIDSAVIALEEARGVVVLGDYEPFAPPADTEHSDAD